MFELILSSIKVIGITLVAVIAFLFLALLYVNVTYTRPRVAELRRKGVHVVKGSESLFGRIDFFAGFFEEAAKTEEMESQHQFWSNRYARQDGKEEWNAADYPVMAVFLLNQPLFFLSDPTVVQDLMTTKNNYFDKSKQLYKVFQELLGEAFIFAPGDENWKAKRKACTHAFYKDRLSLMLDSFKDQIEKTFAKWNQQIEKSADGSTVIDIYVEFERIFQRNIITIAFGEDVSEEKVECSVETSPGSGVYIQKTVSLGEALHMNTEDIAKNATAKVLNPVNIFWRFTGKIYSLTKRDHVIDENSGKIRAFIQSYVQERKSGKRKSSIKDNADLLSLFFKNPDVFTDECIIDELCDFFLAASATTQSTMQTIISHLIKKREDLQHIRNEFDDIWSKMAKDDGSIQNLSREEAIRKVVDLESIMDFDWLNRLTLEALRYQSPTRVTSVMIPQKDVKIGNLELRKGEASFAYIQGLSHNKEEWQKPDQFLLERWDPKSPLYLTPAGKKRNPFSFIPFSAGKRVCFGKVFAEVNLKILTSYVTQFYDFEFEDAEKYKDKYPLAYIFYPHTRQINVKLSKREL